MYLAPHPKRSLKKMNFPISIILAVFMALTIRGLADSPASPRPWVTVSKRGDFFFKMVPLKWKKRSDAKDVLEKDPFGNVREIVDGEYVVEREPFGIVYKITEDGEFKEVWRTEGWYAFEGYLSEDGQYFVRFGPWASDQENHTDLAIAFYDRGKLLKKYQVKELIRKPDLLEDSVSHYMWRPATQTEPNGFYGGAFHLTMIDKTTYRFDFKTGAIISREQGSASNR